MSHVEFDNKPIQPRRGIEKICDFSPLSLCTIRWLKQDSSTDYGQIRNTQWFSVLLSVSQGQRQLDGDSFLKLNLLVARYSYDRASQRFLAFQFLANIFLYLRVAWTKQLITQSMININNITFIKHNCNNNYWRDDSSQIKDHSHDEHIEPMKLHRRICFFPTWENLLWHWILQWTRPNLVENESSPKGNQAKRW